MNPHRPSPQTSLSIHLLAAYAGTTTQPCALVGWQIQRILQVLRDRTFAEERLQLNEGLGKGLGLGLGVRV